MRLILDLVERGPVHQERVDEAARRLLLAQFRPGLFGDPYVDAAGVDGIVGKRQHRAAGLQVRKQSIVLPQNREQGAGKPLPLAAVARPSAAGHDTAIIRGPVVRSGRHALARQRKDLSRRRGGHHRCGHAPAWLRVRDLQQHLA